MGIRVTAQLTGWVAGAVEPAPALAASPFRIAVLVPCLNEAHSIAQVIAGFRAALPGAEVHVYDNNSSDQTAQIAKAEGANVRPAALKGKGNTVRRMFSDVDADVYLLVDGDGTYDCMAAPAMISLLLEEGLDMVCGRRVTDDDAAYRTGHRFGNRLLTGMVDRLFGRRFEDMLTGYRVFSRRFVKSFPAHSVGFEIETELTVHALRMRLPALEIDTRYVARLDGSESKLHTVRDGLRILRMIGLLLRDERPLQFFSVVAGLFACLAAILAAPVFKDYLTFGQVPRMPSLIAATGFGVSALLSLACGLILDVLSRARLEQRHFAYLAVGPTLERRQEQRTAS